MLKKFLNKEIAFWGNNYYDNPPLTNELVEKAEQELKVKLPEALINLLRIQNGGYTKGFAFPMSVCTTWAEDHVPLTELSGIVSGNFKSMHNILLTEYMIEEWDLPERQVLLCGDGHWWITLDYRNNVIPTVRWLDVDCEEDIHVADSFEDFINGLVSEDQFAE